MHAGAPQGQRDLDGTVARLLAACRALQKAAASADEGASMISARRLEVLLLLAHNHACHMGELARALDVDPSTATRTVEALVERGLVERRRDSRNRRYVTVVPTNAGLLAARHLGAARRERVLRGLHRMHPTRQAQLADLVDELANNLTV